MERKGKPSAIPVSPTVPSASVNLDTDRVTATLPSGETVSILLYGATVISWKTANGKEHLWLSEKAILDGSKPVRGGIPLVFPVFGKPTTDATSKLPQHGFARNSKWEFLGKSTSESFKGKANSDTSVALDFGLSANSLTPDFRKAWPYDFNLIYTVTLSPTTLETSIQVQNSGTEESFDFNLLFHTYFRVADIAKAGVQGLAGAQLKDKVKGGERSEGEQVVGISAETDRVYQLAAEKPLAIVEGGKPSIVFERQNLPDVVVWNPWEGYTKMGDFAPGYEQMLCVEPGNVSKWQKVEPGENFEATVVMRVA